MDLLTRFLKFLGVPVYEPLPPTPGASSSGLLTDPTDRIEPVDYEPSPVNIDMVMGSQPSNLLAAQSVDAAPSATSPSALPLGVRFYGEPIIPDTAQTQAGAKDVTKVELFNQNGVAPLYTRGPFVTDYGS